MSDLLAGVRLDDFAEALVDPVVAQNLRTFYGGLFDDVVGLFGGTRAASREETVLLLPGILGTELYDGPGDLLWIDPLELTLDDGLGRLRMEPGATPADDRTPGARRGIQPGDPMRAFYGPMASYLREQGFTVVPRGYDWRLPIDVAAEILAADLQKQDRASIVAHSMGCLVTRRCVQMHPELLDRITQAVFMAPPMLGAFIPAEAVTGQYLVSQLVGLVLGDARVIGCLRSLPGLVELLVDPAAFASSWETFKAGGVLDRFADPLVERARAFAARLRPASGPEADADGKLLARTSIVLTSSLPTPVGVALKDGGVEFTKKVYGDDSVPTSSAWDARARAHYRSTFSHPIIPLQREVIRGVGQLLESGGAATSFLARYDTRPTEPAETVDGTFGDLAPFITALDRPFLTESTSLEATAAGGVALRHRIARRRLHADAGLRQRTAENRCVLADLVLPRQLPPPRVPAAPAAPEGAGGPGTTPPRSRPPERRESGPDTAR